MRLTTTLGLAAAVALALASPAAASPGDQLTGGGISSFGTTFGFTAHDGPKGPSGHATFKLKGAVGPNADRRGHVVCINVQGTRAVFGVEDVDETNGVQKYREFFVEDRGNGNKGQPDLLTEVGTSLTPPPASCNNSPASPHPGLPITNGNIEVRDR